MLYPFTKMHGCGNDYIYINCFETPLDTPEDFALKFSDRHFGIGGDGVILITPSEVADARMRMFNADGSEGSMCGNGIRCVAKFVADHHLAEESDVLTIETKSGIKTLRLMCGEDGLVSAVEVDMGKAEFAPHAIPADFSGDSVVGAPLTVDGKTYEVTLVSMGNPHCVVFCDDVASLNLEAIGPSFEHHEKFPDRINTEFVRVMDDHTLEMRVWERGSGETWACGTGTCATVAAACALGICPKDEEILVHLRGGDLTIRYTDKAVYMTGPATEVFHGFVEYECKPSENL
jgi:diaminopimelate epimerase